MLCQNCNKKEANVKYTQIINGVKKQMNLCEKCAKELGVDDISFNMQMNFSNFFGNFFDDIESGIIPSLIKPQTVTCEKCGSSYEDFIKNGKFGCDKCYETFSEKIDVLLKNIHGVNKHVGRNFNVIESKVKNNESKIETKQIKIEKLQERLKKEIKDERYEDAAKTRDEIKKIEKGEE